jgi:cytochrome c553
MKKTFQAALLLLVILGVATSLTATVDAQKQFVAAYPDAKAKLGNCKTCHTMSPKPAKGAPELNAYGKDLEEKALDKKTNTYDFKKVAGLDSDGDGVKNADEIKAGTNPGDKASK